MISCFGIHLIVSFQDILQKMLGRVPFYERLVALHLNLAQQFTTYYWLLFLNNKFSWPGIFQSSLPLTSYCLFPYSYSVRDHRYIWSVFLDPLTANHWKERQIWFSVMTISALLTQVARLTKFIECMPLWWSRLNEGMNEWRNSVCSIITMI